MTDVKMPEPGVNIAAGKWEAITDSHYYTAAQMLAIHEQGRLAGLEEAAKVCLDQATTVSMHVSSDYALIDHNAISRCVSAIRALAASDGGNG